MVFQTETDYILWCNLETAVNEKEIHVSHEAQLKKCATLEQSVIFSSKLEFFSLFPLYQISSKSITS